MALLPPPLSLPVVRVTGEGAQPPTLVALLLLPLGEEEVLHHSRVLLQQPAHVESSLSPPLLLFLSFSVVASFAWLPETKEGRQGHRRRLNPLLVLAGILGGIISLVT